MLLKVCLSAYLFADCVVVAARVRHFHLVMGIKGNRRCCRSREPYWWSFPQICMDQTGLDSPIVLHQSVKQSMNDIDDQPLLNPDKFFLYPLSSKSMLIT